MSWWVRVIRRMAVAGLVLGVILPAVPAWADVPPLWVQEERGRDGLDDVGTAVVVNPRDGLVHVVGQTTVADQSSDIALVTYTAAGEKLRVRRYDSPSAGRQGSTDRPVGVALDPGSGTVYVAGSTLDSAGSSLVTMAYGRSGPPLWVAEYARDGAIVAAADFVRDPERGTLYVVGYSATGASEQLVLAYDAAGTLLWESTRGLPDSQVSAAAAAVDPRTGTLFVTGSRYDSRTAQSSVLTTAIGPGGQLLWVRSVPGRGGSAIAVDPTNGVVYVSGVIGDRDAENYLTVAYSTTGRQLWSRTFGTAGPDLAIDLAVNPAGDGVFVTGRGAPVTGPPGANPDYLTVAYGPEGRELWSQRYEGPAGGDFVADMVVDPVRRVLYVTGESEAQRSQNSPSDVATVAYSLSGDQLRVDRYTTPFFKVAGGSALDVNARDGRVVVTGSSLGPGTDFDALTLAYPPAA